MSLITKKMLKNKINETIAPSEQSSNRESFQVENCESTVNETHENKSLNDLITKCGTILSMYENSSKKTGDIDKQLKEIRIRTNSHIEYLEQITKDLVNLNFSHPKKNMEFCRMEPNTCLEAESVYCRENMIKLIEKINTKRDAIKKQRLESRSQHQEKCDNYQKAIMNIYENFQEIENMPNNCELLE